MTRLSLRSAIGILTLVALTATADVAMAGPPLLCHPFDIGTAKSLTWDNSNGWQGRVGATSMKTLVADTEALLTPDTPVIVRMETIRRAALYASTDAQVATRTVHASAGAREQREERRTGNVRRGLSDRNLPSDQRHANAGRATTARKIQFAALKSLVGKADGEAMVQQTLDRPQRRTRPRIRRRADRRITQGPHPPTTKSTPKSASRRRPGRAADEKPGAHLRHLKAGRSWGSPHLKM